jgi:hypothetical protein
MADGGGLMESSEERHVHIYLGDLPPGTTVHIHASELTQHPKTTETTEGGPASRHDDPASAMLERLKTYGHPQKLQAIYDGLIELGFVPHAPEVRKAGKEPEPYLRWTDPARGGTAVLYFDTKNLWFVKKEDMGKLRDLGGKATLDGRSHNVKFIMTSMSVTVILDGARRIKY